MWKTFELLHLWIFCWFCKTQIAKFWVVWVENTWMKYEIWTWNGIRFCRKKRSTQEMEISRFTNFMHNLRIFNHLTSKMSKHAQLSVQFSWTHSTQSCMNPWTLKILQLKKHSRKLFTTLKYLMHNLESLEQMNNFLGKYFEIINRPSKDYRTRKNMLLSQTTNKWQAEKFQIVEKVSIFKARLETYFISLLFNINITKQQSTTVVVAVDMKDVVETRKKSFRISNQSE